MATTRTGALIVIALLLGACASAPVDEKTASAEGGYGRAFGLVRLVDDGKEVSWASSLMAHETLTLFVRPARGGEMQYMDIPPGGAFFWPLRPGEYTLVGFQLTRRAGTVSTRNLRLMASFNVPRAGQAVYIGDLLVESRGGRVSRIEVLDRYDAGLQRAAEPITTGKLAPAKELMRLERPADRVRAVTGICTGSWGVVCDANYQGVRPVQPEGTERSYVATSSLTPMLEWQPASRAEVTYDVAIYESLHFNYGLIGSVQGLQGARVAYAEDLRAPRFMPSSPLEPGKRYQWTVRVRDGDTVSTWSTTSYSLYIVIAARRASGQYFGFETP